MTEQQGHSPTIQSLQQEIVEEVTEEWQTLTEEDDEDTPQSFADALKDWYDNQMQELHDSRGDAEYQGQTVQMLNAFRQMVEQIKSYDFGFAEHDEWLRIEQLPRDEYMAALRKNSAVPE